jgi:hypothetical protein
MLYGAPVGLDDVGCLMGGTTMEEAELFLRITRK